MPTVSVDRDALLMSLEKDYKKEEFDELCFKFGIELDDVVEDPEKGTVTYKIEVGANRYDLLCLEGISRTLRIYLGIEKAPRFKTLKPKHPDQYKIIVKPNTAQVRPYIVGAVLRNFNFTQTVYDSFIDLQDKLHQNIARKRTLVAIGTHDLDTITGPFIYDARPPKDISFVPLNQTQSVRSDVLLEKYSHDSYLKEYVPIIKDKPVYPIITDQAGVVLSLPPIINGDHSKITLNTRNIFIECTATDKYKAQIVLDTLVCMFSQYCAEAFTAETVQVEYPNGEQLTYPVLQYRHQETSAKYCNVLAGTEETTEDIASLLKIMNLEVEVEGQDKLLVEVPPTRYDILHPCDVAEDFAIAYGFDKLANDAHLPSTPTIGQECQLNYLSDKMRLLFSQNNYIEAATFSLCSKMDIGERMRLKLESEPWVKVGNPKTSECEALRTSLLPGLLKTLSANKHIPLPLRMFEVADVVVRDKSSATTRGTGARNQRHMCAINYNVRPGMEVMQGLLDNIMLALKVPFNPIDGAQGYCLKGKDHSTYFSGFCGSVEVNGVEVGRLGLVHPQVITNFNLNNPASVLELDLQKTIDITSFGQ